MIIKNHANIIHNSKFTPFLNTFDKWMSRFGNVIILQGK